MKKNLFSVTANGIEVMIEEETLHHMEAHPDVPLAVVKEAIEKIGHEYNGQFGMISVDLGRIIGTDNCVPVTDENRHKVQHMYRKGREGKTPVILNGTGEPTSIINVGICKDSEDGLQTFFTSFLGVLAPKEPWDPRLKDSEKEESVKFWSEHALVLPEDAIDFDR